MIDNLVVTLAKEQEDTSSMLLSWHIRLTVQRQGGIEQREAQPTNCQQTLTVHGWQRFSDRIAHNMTIEINEVLESHFCARIVLSSCVQGWVALRLKTWCDTKYQKGTLK